MLYKNKLENRITFKIKAVYYLELFTPETMKLLESTKSKINKDNKNGENVSPLQITEVVLVYLLTMMINTIQECCTHLFLINHLVNY